MADGDVQLEHDIQDKPKFFLWFSSREVCYRWRRGGREREANFLELRDRIHRGFMEGS